MSTVLEGPEINRAFVGIPFSTTFPQRWLQRRYCIIFPPGALLSVLEESETSISVHVLMARGWGSQYQRCLPEFLWLRHRWRKSVSSSFRYLCRSSPVPAFFLAYSALTSESGYRVGCSLRRVGCRWISHAPPSGKLSQFPARCSNVSPNKAIYKKPQEE